MKRIRCLAVCGWALAMALTQGCLFSRMKVNADGLHGRLLAVRPGMTLDQVVRTTGELPHAMLPSPEGTIAVYNMGDVKTKGLMLILFNVTRTTSSFSSAYLFLDKANRVHRVWMDKSLTEPPWLWWPFTDERAN